MKRRTRHLAALVAIAAMLFAPIASAARACAGMEGMGHSMAEMAAMAAMMPGMAAATDAASAPVEPGPCERQCFEARKSFDALQPSAAVAPAAPPPMHVPAVTPLLVRVPERAVPYVEPGPAPPLIRTTVLRI